MADGKIGDEELTFIKAVIEACGGDVDEKSIIKVTKEFGRDDEVTVRMMIDTIARRDPETAGNMVMLALMMTGVDGKVDRKERKFIMEPID
ncbi:MAG: TerB family tellurite resistance protein [archaeon]|nr:TerB family tellurite resistance protein [archaeon]